ncbi:ATPase, T2SS/T4P/T4SS family [Moraxella sp. ZJ142]|uniref:ATPase, T2SS/T4P/T4SS family n=1 Tax=Moraxella marmotae TaxID=3344520 RepID=UPI0035D4A244
MVTAITNMPNALTLVSRGLPVSGLARLLQGDQVDMHNATEYIEFEFQRKTRYRYEIVGASGLLGDNAYSMVMRPLPAEPPLYSDLKIPMDFINECIVPQGMVIIAGATGEGKTTTLSSVIRYIMENDTLIKGNIITHEDPIEIPYDLIKSEHSYVTQSAIGPHIQTFDAANRAAMRRSSDLILVGELRDDESVDKAVELSLTGHPVFATTHSSNVSAIMPRLLSRFPKEMQTQKCFDILEAARLFASQKLIWRTDGTLMAVREYLPFSSSLRSYLKQYSETPSVVSRKIAGIMKEGLFGVDSFEAQGKRFLEDGIISEESYRHLTSKDEPFTDEVQEKLDSF